MGNYDFVSASTGKMILVCLGIILVLLTLKKLIYFEKLIKKENFDRYTLTQKDYKNLAALIILGLLIALDVILIWRF